ncbi:MAG: HAD-IC family P-type ATPase [Anaerolineae bacterium]
MAVETVHITGLTEDEAAARRARGQGNDVHLETSQTYLQIVRRNAFTFINTVLFGIGIVLILMGQLGDAVVTAGLVLLNVIVGVFQEARAKRTLDRIALLTRPQAAVIRDGVEKRVDPAEVVLGDALVVGSGDQIVVDGVIVSGRVDVDESLLTGESDLIPKQVGDEVLSGSFAVTGRAVYEATRVGASSFANRLTAGARQFRQIKTPLQLDVDLVIRALVFVASQLGLLLAISYAIQNTPIVETVRVAAVIVALVPQGLFFMVTVTYALGAVRIAGKGALVQQSNAVESLSNVKVLCTDKTGTLTTNRIQLESVTPVGIDEATLRNTLGAYVASMSDVNRTAEAIGAACPGEPRRVADEVAFSSARKWSAVAFDDGDLRGAYVLGAPEMLWDALEAGAAQIDALRAQVDAWAGQGLRVLLFARNPSVMRFTDARPPKSDLDSAAAGAGSEAPQLPAGLVPLGALALSDELRSDARATLQGFAEAGVGIKVISGDNPDTVAALARQVGLGGDDLRVVSGLELAAMDDAAFAQAAEEGTIFGRITPQQKERLVRLLRDRGYYVAMIGDGVNDMLSLKQAQLGIAMQSGSQATRSVADIVLINDSFAVLPSALQEGQRIVNGMQDIVRLFLARTFSVTLLIIGAAIIGLPFPITPKHNSLLALWGVGIPTFALALWARPGRPARGLLRTVVHFVFPAAFTIAAFSLGVYLYYLLNTNDVNLARTALTTTAIFCGLMLIVFVEPPTRFWVGGDNLSGDARPALMAGALLLAYMALMGIAPLRAFFELAPLYVPDYALIVAVVAVWALAVRFMWRGNWFERLLDLDVSWSVRS